MVRLIAVIALLGIGNALSLRSTTTFRNIAGRFPKWNLAIFTSDRWRVDPNESEFCRDVRHRSDLVPILNDELTGTTTPPATWFTRIDSPNTSR